MFTVAGQLAVPDNTVQVTALQLKPVATGSFTVEPPALEGPPLDTVMV